MENFMSLPGDLNPFPLVIVLFWMSSSGHCGLGGHFTGHYVYGGSGGGAQQAKSPF